MTNHGYSTQTAAFSIGFRSTRTRKTTSGFTLIELMITIIILGLVGYSFSMMESHIVFETNDQKTLTKAVILAEEKMEGAVAEGTGIQSIDWTDCCGLEWRRSVNMLESEDGTPTLVEVTVEVRSNGKVVCSLYTHVAE